MFPLHTGYLLPIQVLDTYAGPKERVFAPATPGDAGVDLYATDDVVLRPGQRKLVKTGISVALPSGRKGLVQPKSGLAAKRGLTVLNTPGLVDEGYRGEIGVILMNTNPVVTENFVDVLLDVLSGGSSHEDLADQFDLDSHDSTIHIARGDKIAQFVVGVYERPTPHIVSQLPETVRGTGGFGSTGER